ncbi:MAG: ankyrin repeat domain-containing protein, partial [Crocinitomicaceae bacterium]|nr:ankyrin repeat domain-containing protein [Crocinitomicaceae bacterium]
RKTLPKDFQELLVKGNIQELIQLFDKCEIEARGGYCKQTALAFSECPHELAKWLVEKGANIEALDDYKSTPLIERSRRYNGNIESLIKLGADVNYNTGKATPLHCAAEAHNVGNVEILLAHGAKFDALVSHGYSSSRADYTPLELTLLTCRNIDIENTVKISKILLNTGAKKTERMKDFVTKIGESFEFHNPNYNDLSTEWTNNGLQALYQLFDTEPVPKRLVHDGKSPIILTTKTWQNQHDELWKLLVPARGAAQTMQGEVLRITGKVTRELLDNGGGNWDLEYKKMVDSYFKFVQQGNKLSQEEISKLSTIVEEVKKGKSTNIYVMSELAVEWVLRNPTPISLPEVDYSR